MNFHDLITKALAALAEGTNTQPIQFRNLALFPAPDIQKSARAQIDASRAEATALLETLVKLVQSEKGLALWQIFSSCARPISN